MFSWLKRRHLCGLTSEKRLGLHRPNAGRQRMTTKGLSEFLRWVEAREFAKERVTPRPQKCIVG
jgi:hypothetical protein